MMLHRCPTLTWKSLKLQYLHVQMAVEYIWDGMLVLLTCLVVCTTVQLSVYILCRWTENFEMRSGLGLVFSVAGNSG